MKKADVVQRLGAELDRAKEKLDMYSRDSSRSGFALEQLYAGKVAAYRLALRMIEMIDDCHP